MTGSASGGSPLATGTELSLSDFADLALETAADSIFVMDDQGRTVFANAAAERTFGWTRRELVGHKLHDLIHHHYPDGRPFPMAECPLGRVFETRTRLERHEDVFFHRGGEPISVACSNAPLVRDGRMIGAILVAVDITERKRTEEHQRLLLNELTHRVKNTLSLVQAIVRQSIRPGMATADCKAAIDERLIALGRAHDILIRERWEGADLLEIVTEAARPFSARGDTFEIDGTSLRLKPAKALSVALALEELGTNATKYGSLSAKGGSVHVRWTVSGPAGERRMFLRWEERGGPPVKPPTSKGFGTRLLERSLAYDLDGTVRLDFNPDGLVCEVEAALD